MTKRLSARALLLTPENRILLMKLQEPVTGVTFWITPGGAAEAGETILEGLRRELREETGHVPREIGPPIWTRSHRYTWNSRVYEQDEVYYLVPTDRFDPVMDTEAAPGESAAFRAFRWWSIDEMRTSDDAFGPQGLVALLARLLDTGPPDPPIDITPDLG